MNFTAVVKTLLSYPKCKICGLQYRWGISVSPYSRILLSGGGEVLNDSGLHLSSHSSLISEGAGIIFHGSSMLHRNSKIHALNGAEVEIGDRTHFQPSSLVYAHADSRIAIGQGTVISELTRITAENEVVIGDNVLMGPHVFIADYNHEYRDVTKPINRQGHVSKSKTGEKNKVSIGAGSWLGTNVVIVGNVSIGEHCVIGANAVVTKDIPSMSVAVGNPAKVVKRYNRETDKWQKVK